MGDFKKDKQVAASDALERESRGKQNRSVRGFVGEGKKEKVISALAAGFVGFNISYGAWFPPPGMVYEQFSVDAKQFVKVIRVTLCDALHGSNAMIPQPICCTLAHPPEVC